MKAFGTLDTSTNELSCQLTVGDVTYLISSETVATVNPEGLASLELEKWYKEIEAQDDVWCRDFLNGLVIPKSHAEKQLEQERFSILFYLSDDMSPPAGPYVVHRWTGGVHQVSRLYSDTHDAFIYGLVRSCGVDGAFRELAADRIAVPSRLYHPSSPDKPLAGCRFAVKDLLDIKGCKTGAGNRAWTDLYAPKSTTAEVVVQLLELGAVLIGKTKTSQFAEGSEPSEWIEYQCPFNPRGDGFQKPSSSSTGSAAAVAAYPWLDFTIGTDTGGSIRHPAGVNGVYGCRPSLTFTSTVGAFQVTSLMDTIGLFTRSASLLGQVGRLMMSPSYVPAKPSIPRYRLLCMLRSSEATTSGSPQWFRHPGSPGPSTLAAKMLEDTISRMEYHLGCTRHLFDVDELWAKTKPERESGSLDEAIGKIYSIMTTYTSVRQVIDPFIREYRKQNDNRSPFIEPVIRERQQFGREQTEETFAAAVRCGTSFSKWVNEVLLTSADPDEIPLLLFPQSLGIPNYRDSYGRTVFWDKFSLYSFGYLGGCPDYTVPIGEVPYMSRITEREAFLPVSLSIIGRKGHDLVLFDILKGLDRQGILKEVKTGSRLFPTSNQ